MERENKMALKLLSLKEKLIKLELSVKDDDVLFNQFAILSTDFKEYNKLVIAKSQKSEDFGRDLNDRTNLFIDNHWEDLRKRIVFEKRSVEKPNISKNTESNAPLSASIKMPYYLIWFLFLLGGFILGILIQYKYNILNKKLEGIPTLHTPDDTTNRINIKQRQISEQKNNNPNRQESKIQLKSEDKKPQIKTIIISIAELVGGAKFENVPNEIASIKDQIKNINKYDIKISANEHDATYRLSIGFSEGNQKVDYELVLIKTDSVICSSGSPKSLDQATIELVKCLKKDNL